MKKRTSARVKIKINTFVDDVFHHDETCKQFVWIRDGRLVIKFGGQHLPVNLVGDEWIAERRVRTIKMTPLMKIQRLFEGDCNEQS